MYEAFYKALGDVMPCKDCADHFQELMHELPVSNFLDTGSVLFEWTVLVHNRVNRRLGRDEWALDRAHHHHALPNTACACGGIPNSGDG